MPNGCCRCFSQSFLVREAQSVVLEVEMEFFASPHRIPRLLLADLVAQCDQSAREPEDMALWAVIKPVGREYGALADGPPLEAPCAARRGL